MKKPYTYIENEYYLAIGKYFEKKLGNKEKANALLPKLYEMYSVEDDTVLDFLAKNGIQFDSLDDLNNWCQLETNARNNTRNIFIDGDTPNERAKKLYGR